MSKKDSISPEMRRDQMRAIDIYIQKAHTDASMRRFLELMHRKIEGGLEKMKIYE